MARLIQIRVDSDRGEISRQNLPFVTGQLYIAKDDTLSNYLVYQPLSFQREDDNWMLKLQLYSEEFRADLNSIWMDEMGLLPLT